MSVFLPENSDVQLLIHRCIREHFLTHEGLWAHLEIEDENNPSIVPLFKDGKVKNNGNLDIVKLSAMTDMLSAFIPNSPEYVITICKALWDYASDQQREAAIVRALSSLVFVENEKTGDVKIRLVKPDIQYYYRERESFGEWLPKLMASFVDQQVPQAPSEESEESE
jgi:hypothetical protein